MRANSFLHSHESQKNSSFLLSACMRDFLLPFLLVIFAINPARAASKFYDDETLSSFKEYFENAPDAILFYSNTLENSRFSVGEEEALYFKTIPNALEEWDLPLQLKFPGVKDQVFEQLIFSITENFTSTANPGAWILSAHYPSGVGNEKVDAALKEWAKNQFMETLPADPEALDKIRPSSWLKSVKKQKSKYGADGPGLLFESFAEKCKEFGNKSYSSDYIKKLTSETGIGPVFNETLTYVITRPSKRYLSVIFTAHTYWGGAHSNWNSEVYNFDLETGERLKNSDIFIGNDLDIARLRKKLGNLAKEQDIDWLFLSEDMRAMFDDVEKIELGATKVALTSQGLVFIFDPYEIASFAKGTVTLLIPADDVDFYGINAKYWNKAANSESNS